MLDMFWTDNESLELYTYSTGGKGSDFGIHFQGQWTHELWSDSWLETPLIRNVFRIVSSRYCSVFMG